MLPTLVIPEPEYECEVLDCFQSFGREVTVEDSETILGDLKPSLDVVALTATQTEANLGRPSPKPSGRADEAPLHGWNATVNPILRETSWRLK